MKAVCKFVATMVTMDNAIGVPKSLQTELNSWAVAMEMQVVATKTVIKDSKVATKAINVKLINSHSQQLQEKTHLLGASELKSASVTKICRFN